MRDQPNYQSSNFFFLIPSYQRVATRFAYQRILVSSFAYNENNYYTHLKYYYLHPLELTWQLRWKRRVIQRYLILLRERVRSSHSFTCNIIIHNYTYLYSRLSPFNEIRCNFKFDFRMYNYIRLTVV